MSLDGSNHKGKQKNEFTIWELCIPAIGVELFVEGADRHGAVVAVTLPYQRVHHMVMFLLSLRPSYHVDMGGQGYILGKILW